ncbi:MAG: serine/threonine protein kinase [Deltaproteobacteria bacterium]|nr:serine/threonine protein kinase [Deltaproteobacteria bacterium]
MPAPGDATAQLPSGTRLGGRYIIRKLMGSGGMSQLYLGEHEIISKPVAIKVLAESMCTQEAVVGRFLHEARASSKVQHEHIVEVTDFGGADDGRPFMVMEYLDGEDLGETLIREGPFSWERARPMLLQLLAALQAAHDAGVIHRDIKPENIFRISRMGSDDYIKVLDFGIAKVYEEGQVTPSTPQTLDGKVLGTPAYMSPEQCLGEDLDARSDLYAVGVIAFQMLTGHTPFESKAPIEVMRKHVYEAVPPMAEVDPELGLRGPFEIVVRRALEKNPNDRYQSAWDFAEALFEDIDLLSSSVLPGLRNLFRRRARRG